MSEPRDAVGEVLDELHQVRREIDARFDNDPRKYGANLRDLHERLLREGWTEAPPPPNRGKSA